MSQLEVSVQWMGDAHARIFADPTGYGPDGVDTYHWSWGIDSHAGYLEMGKGDLQHRETLGSLALLQAILSKLGLATFETPPKLLAQQQKGLI
jgi:hypothetical protein